MRTIRVVCWCLAFVGLDVWGVALARELPVPDIRLNQLGFQPDGAKRAIVKSATRTPLEWELRDASGSILARGKSEVFGENAGSGEHVHIIDFSAFRGSGKGFVLVAGKHESRPFTIENDVFAGLKYDALAYFYHNRSGTPIEAQYAKDAKWARPAGHAPEIVRCFDKADVRGNKFDGCDYELDVTGGWYDAGDHGKYVVNAGITVWTLLNYYERTRRLPGVAENDPFADGRASIPERDNGVNDLLDEVRWELRFMLGMQVPQGGKLRVPKPGTTLPPFGTPPAKIPPLELVELDLSGMAHHKVHGEEWTPMPSAPHEDRKPRYAYPPTTTATLNLAAVAAQCARIWKSIDAEFAARCLEAARNAYAAAERYPDLMPVAWFSGGGGYGDRDASDELYWAAAELFVTTGEQKYYDALRASPHFLAAPAADGSGEITWSQVRTLGTISLAVVPNGLPAAELARAREALVAAADRYLQQASREGYAIPYSSDRYEWGSNSTILNRAIVLALAYDLTGKRTYRDRVVDALDYLLGRNPLDQSYVSGYGVRPMRNPHHRFWAQQKDPKLPPPPPGALSGGPNNTNMSDPIAQKLKGSCRAQTCWIDHADAYALNEVAINWNAPLVWVSAFVDEVR